MVVGFFDEFSGYQETILAEALRKMGHDVSVVASNRCNPIFSNVTDSQGKTYGVGTSSGPLGMVRRLKASVVIRSMVFCRGLSQAIRETTPDIVVFFYPGQLMPALAAIQLRKWQGPKKVAVYADNEAQIGSLRGVSRLAKAAAFRGTKGILYRLVNKSVDCVLGNTGNCLQIIDEYSKGNATQLLPLGYREEIFRLDGELRHQVRDRLGIRPEEILVANVGKMQPVKKIEILCVAIENLLRDEMPVRLFLGGANDSEYCQKIREMIQSSELLEHAVTMTGFIDQKEINGMYNAADVGVWPVQPAVSIQQAMGTGLFVVLPKNDYVDHLLTEETGLYFAEGDDHQLEEALKSIVSESKLLESKSRAARAQQNAGRYSGRAIAEFFLQLVHQSRN